MADFLLELRSEEIPARMQAGARAELEKLFRRELDAAGVAVSDVTVWSTPRRLALIARDLPQATEAVSEEAKGPPVGAPDQAVDGFCRKAGVTRDQLEVRDVKGRETYFAVIETPGRAMTDLLAEAIPAIIRDFSWPKSMRWGDASISTESLRWVRPLSGIVALLDGEVVRFDVDGIESGRETKGHRFHHSGAITIGSADDYAEKLRACHVIVDHEERQDAVRSGAKAAAEAAGLTLVEDEGLVIENAGLTEWPVPLLGRFDESYLDVPPEVIQLTARVNQKYFVCTRAPAQAGASGDSAQPKEVPASAGTHALANAFVCTANIAAEDPAVVVDGNRKVLAARLSDARFFWELDQKTSLADHAKKLERITFHEKLGTVADKVERVAKLARWLVEEEIVTGASPREGGDLPEASAKPNKVPAFAGTREELANLAEQAARLCKADLVTEMVGEFPELQGLMGGYYAEKESLPQEVSDAIRDHYKPVGQGDEVPTAPVTVAVSLADKLDTLVGFFLVGEWPTGSKDPFALRRAVLGVISLIRTGLRLNLARVVGEAAQSIIAEWLIDAPEHVSHAQIYARDFEWTAAKQAEAREIAEHTKGMVAYPRQTTFLGVAEIADFFADRLKVQQREAGVRHDLIDAVFALGGEDDLVRLLARVKALQSFIETDNGANLLAGYKRAANILKKEEWAGEGNATDLSYTPEPAEKALIDALNDAEPKAAAAIEAEDFEAAMSALASLRSPIDQFFEEVTVNDNNADKRSARLDLLARFRNAVHRVADFSRIEG
ncbi:glycine--tRNA ligase subunit beta [Altererythrobacter sp. GH1-8]|uniref:glycine--tRNA ligase subunit beta n=1 Tax=Altererythrobacter sp. GH1-8 TaxID=3349333 RepID=UPI00374D2237